MSDLRSRHPEAGLPTVAPRFRVLVWCRDCGNGEDPLGCFDGAHGFIYDDAGDVRLFDTREEAEAEGNRYTSGPPWEFEIEEVVSHG